MSIGFSRLPPVFGKQRTMLESWGNKMWSFQSEESIWFTIALFVGFIGLLIYIGFGARLLAGNGMERQGKIAQFYGYSVCLVAVVAFLFSLASLVSGLFDLSDPLHVSEGLAYPLSKNLTSFESYKMDILNPPYGGQNAPKSTYIPDDATLRRMYEAAKVDKISTVRFRSLRSITTDVIIILAAALLFLLHWRWVRRLALQ
jgi:hypothetical protein